MTFSREPPSDHRYPLAQLDPALPTEGLGVGFPKAALYTVSAAAELVEHHPGRARVHSVVPIEPPHRVESAIHVVDTIVHDNDRVAILNSIFGHVLISAALD